MWFISCLFRFVPLSLLTVLWVIQTAWFWSWLATSLAPGLTLEKANTGIVPFSLNLTRADHPLFHATDVAMDVDWPHFLSTFSWRLATCRIGSLQLKAAPDNVGSSMPDANPFAFAHALCQRVHSWDVTWSDTTHTNHFVRDEQGYCTLIFHGETYHAQLDVTDTDVLVSTRPQASAPVMRAKLTQAGLDVTVADKPWHAHIDQTTWMLSDGEKLNAQGTWHDQHVEGTLSHPLVGTIHGAYTAGNWHVDPFTLYEGIVNIGLQGIMIEHAHWQGVACNARLAWSEKDMPWSLDAHTSQGVASLSGNVQADGRITFKGQAPYVGVLNGYVDPIWSDFMASKLHLTCDARISLSDVVALGANQVVQGDFTGHVTVQGSLRDPHFGGLLQIQNGLYHNVECGVWLSPIELRLRGNGSTWIVEKLVASDRSSRGSGVAQGGVQGSGKITWSPADPLKPVCDITLKLDEVDIAHGDRFQGDASGTLHIVGSEPRVDGDITLHHATVHLDAMDDAENVRVRRDDKLDDDDEDLPKVLPLNFSLTAPGPIVVDGLGFESIWQGNMMVKGYITKPYLVGEISCQKGSMNLLGIAMKIKGSRIMYVEEEINVPQFDITAVHALDSKQKIFFHVTCSADRPVSKFASNMGLSERDIVSRLLFGQSADSISLWQSLQLASVLANINSRKNNVSWMEQLRQSFGIDSFEVKSVETSQGTTAQAPSIGKRLGKVRLSVDAAVSGAPGKATVEANVHPNVVVSADVGGDRSSGVGVDYVYHY